MVEIKDLVPWLHENAEAPRFATTIHCRHNAAFNGSSIGRRPSRVGSTRHGIYYLKFWKNFERQGQKVFSSTLFGRFSHGVSALGCREVGFIGKHGQNPMFSRRAASVARNQAAPRNAGNDCDIPTPPGVKWIGHSLRRGGASAAHAIGVSIAVIMAWGLWKSLASALLYIDVSVRPSSEALFCGHLLARFNLHQAPLVQQAPPTAVSSSMDLSDALQALLEFDD
jgi:hypothetical protein